MRTSIIDTDYSGRHTIDIVDAQVIGRQLILSTNENFYSLLLTHSCLVDLIDVTLACGDANSILLLLLMLMIRIMLVTVCCRFGS